MDGGIRTAHGHKAGAICQRAAYEFVSSGDCSSETLVANEKECEQAIREINGFDPLSTSWKFLVEVWDFPEYAKGCFKLNYGNGPTRYIYNKNGGPGTSGHCTGEPGYAACICRDESLV